MHQGGENYRKVWIGKLHNYLHTLNDSEINIFSQ